MSIVVCKDLVKRFGESIAVDHVNVEIKDSEFMVFVGPSGCGKTTTLRMIGGLESITSGEVLLDGTVINSLAPRYRDMAMVFQNYALYPHYKVYDNIAYPLRLHKVPKPEVEQRVREVARMLDIERFLDRWPRQLSGGERQRVALGRAIVRKPRLFLMDEPLSNLDAKLRVQMRREIIRLQRLLGTTTVYVTHDQVEAMTMGDRIMVLRHGRIQQIGAPETLYNSPANMFVAQFIGSPAMNVFKGQLESSNGDVALASPLGRFVLPRALVGRLSERPGGGPAGGPSGVGGARPVMWGIRPEDMQLLPPGNDAPQALVDLVEGLGSDAYVSMNIGGENIVARTPPDERPPENTTVGLQLNLGKVQLFDPQTEMSLLGNT